MNRRNVLMAGGLLAGGGLWLPGCSPSGTPDAQTPYSDRREDPLAGDALMQDVKTYVAFGTHRAGSSGDKATSNWFADRFASLGYEVEQPEFEILNGDTLRAQISLGNMSIEGFAQPPVTRTPEGGLRAALATWNPAFPKDVEGRIAIVHVPRAAGQWIPGLGYREAFQAARAAGAVGIVAPMSGPSREIVALNTPPAMTFDCPVLIFPEQLKAVFENAVNSAVEVVMRVDPVGGMRLARNTIARRGDRGPWLIVSTPQSGWFKCGGERGPGVAMALALADWAARQDFPNRLLFVTTSGHEWGDTGAHLFHEQQAPEPEDTAFWFHLGASYGARAYEETPEGLKPLDAPNPVRTFMVSGDLMDRARSVFATTPGLEEPTPSTYEAALGELKLVVGEGYPTHAGFFGAHGHFHTPFDDDEATSPEILEPIARSCAALIEAALRRS